MCVRYVFINVKTAVEELGAEPLPGFGPEFNIAPTDPVIAVMERDGARRAWPLKWGLVPSWAKDPSMGSGLVNARAETIAEKPSFKAALKYRRCVLPADGFYEWKGPKGSKQPFFIHRRDGGVLYFAGIWETWERDDGYLETCSIVTTESNREMADLNDRMPVILERDEVSGWLDRTMVDSKRALTFLNSAKDGTLEMYEVDPAVGNPRASGPQLMARIEPRTLF